VLAGRQRDDQYFALAEGEAGVGEDLAGQVRVIDQQADDRTVRRRIDGKS